MINIIMIKILKCLESNLSRHFFVRIRIIYKDKVFIYISFIIISYHQSIHEILKILQYISHVPQSINEQLSFAKICYFHTLLPKDRLDSIFKL